MKNSNDFETARAAIKTDLKAKVNDLKQHNIPIKDYEFQARKNTNPPNNHTQNNQPRIPNIDWSNLLPNTIPSNNQSSNSSTRPGFNRITVPQNPAQQNFQIPKFFK